MPKLTDTIGSGMTERAILRFDWDQPGDAEVQVKAAINTFDRSSFARLSRRLTDLAGPILHEAGLPSDPEQAYVVRPDGTWALLDDTVDLEAERDSDLLPLDQAVLRLGHEPDAPAGFAARVLRTLSQAQHQLEAASLDEAMSLAFLAGELVTEATMKGVFEPDIIAGEKVRAGGREGHKQKYGTAEEKAARCQAYLEAYDQEIAQGAGKMQAYKAVAKKFGVVSKTIQRAVGKRKSEG